MIVLSDVRHVTHSTLIDVSSFVRADIGGEGHTADQSGLIALLLHRLVANSRSAERYLLIARDAD